MSPQKAIKILKRKLQANWFAPPDEDEAAISIAIAALEREAKAEPVAWLMRFGENGQYRSVSIVHPGATYADQELTPLYASLPQESGQ